MAVPITNMKISDIVNALGEQTTNISLRNLHLSPNVIGSGLDPTYCSGANGYERLANLRDTANVGGIRSFYMGKFRNYDPPSIFYRLGFLYNGLCVYNYPTVIDDIVHIAIPDGWHLPTALDWLGLIQAIESGNNFSNNTILPYLRCSYTRVQLTSEGISPNPAWDNAVSKTDDYDFKCLAGGNAITNDDDLVSWGSIGSVLRLWSQKGLSARYQAAVFNSSNDRLDFDVDPGDLPGNKGGDARYAYHYIRLFKDDSNNSGYVEDVQGNVYKTVKIGDYVVMAEGLRTTVDRFGNDLYLATSGEENANVGLPCYINTTQLDIP